MGLSLEVNLIPVSNIKSHQMQHLHHNQCFDHNFPTPNIFWCHQTLMRQNNMTYYHLALILFLRVRVMRQNI
uniref:Uncharacterized protein n=1 Tax=Myoviridae sp. ctKHS5 TaxID=2823541 RepID=A0A8S5L7T4_9CAUD|nr:MAG TPA: hypothetical protein [Myoviridae sp. ctKHS5]